MHEERRQLTRRVVVIVRGAQLWCLVVRRREGCRPRGSDEEVVEAPREGVRVGMLQHDPAVPLAAVREMHQRGQRIARERPQRRGVAPDLLRLGDAPTAAPIVAPRRTVRARDGVEELDQAGSRGRLLRLGFLLAAVVVVLDQHEPGEPRRQLVRTGHGRRVGPVGSRIPIPGGGPP